MSFYGSSFSFDNVSSETFGLKIGELDGSAVNEIMASSSMEIVDQKIYRRTTNYFYGATPSPKLSFPISVFSENEIDADLLAEIQKVYFSTRSYKVFTIDQDDLRDIYFDCMLLDPSIIKIANVTKGISFTVSCSSPFAWHFPKMTAYSYVGSVVDENEVFYNASDDSGAYLYPSLIITMNSTGGDVTITNSDDASRVFQFTGLSANEIITMDCSRQTLNSSTSLKRLGNFNKRYLRLVPGLNHLRIQGGVEQIVMTTQFVAKKI